MGNKDAATPLRQCGSCTKCCEGWLTANINSYSVKPYQPCYMLKQNVGCIDYENRPNTPCRTFSCGWINIIDMPDEFKPNISGVIMHYKVRDNIGRWSIIDAPNNPSQEYLNWAKSFIRSKGQNLIWKIDNLIYWEGDTEFCKYMEKNMAAQ